VRSIINKCASEFANASW